MLLRGFPRISQEKRDQALTSISVMVIPTLPSGFARYFSRVDAPISTSSGPLSRARVSRASSFENRGQRKGIELTPQTRL